MLDDILRDVERLRDEWASRAPLPEEAEVAHLDLGPPRRAEGTDGSGTVHVVIDGDRLPESITADPGWRRALGSERLAGAVLAAYDNACEVQLQARLTDAVEAVPAEPRPEPTVAFDPDRYTIGGEGLGYEAPTGTGTAAFGNVVVVLSLDGLRSFTADPHWLTRTTHDDDLAEAIATALGSAHADLVEAMRARNR